MQTKPQIRQFVNPNFPRGTSVVTYDGRHGKIADHPSQRRSRLILFEGDTVCTMTPLADLVRGRWADGAEFTCSFDGKSLTTPNIAPVVL